MVDIQKSPVNSPVLGSHNDSDQMDIDIIALNNNFITYGYASIAKPDYLQNDALEYKHISGDDSYFLYPLGNKIDLVAGVADGVGGWSYFNVDPCVVSRLLMMEVFDLVTQNLIQCPKLLLGNAYENIKNKNKTYPGSTTTCIVKIKENDDKILLQYANLGDSGLVIVRDNKIFFETEPQRENKAPYQLAIITPEIEHLKPINNKPEEADYGAMFLENNDIIILATDGLWDNIEKNELLDIVNSESIAENISLKLKNHAIEKNKKPDDTTIIVFKVYKH